MELAGTLVLPAAIAFTLYLIIVAIIPGTVKPVLSLILLAIILGIPGVLIVVTSRKVAYLGWMLIYLMSLPIWNFGELLVLAPSVFEHRADLSLLKSFRSMPSSTWTTSLGKALQLGLASLVLTLSSLAGVKLARLSAMMELPTPTRMVCSTRRTSS